MNHSNLGALQDKMKLAKVIPMFQKGFPLKTSVHRRISLGSVLNKITEKVMFESLYKFLGKHETLFT